MIHRIAIILTILLCTSAHALAQASGQDSARVKHRGLIGRVVGYLESTNRPRPAKKFDISFIGGPHYASDTRFGIGIVGAGSYTTDLADTVTPRSDIAVTADVSTVGFYMLGLNGTHRARHDRIRLLYDFRFYSFPTYYWGLGYDNGRLGDDHRSKFLEFSFGGNARMLGRMAPGLYIGPAFGFKWLRAKNPEKPWLWDGQRLKTVCLGLGLSLRYDTRDNLTAPESGVVASLEQRFYPRFMASPYSFATTEAEAAAYRRVWRGGVLAGKLHAKLCYGRVPWSMLATFGGSYTMRGYYEGRYRDYDAADLTLELRQHITGRSGAVVWAGIGAVAPRLSRFVMRNVLPEVGIGYRWEFKRHCNVRLDYGLGRRSSGFVFSINEAF